MTVHCVPILALRGERVPVLLSAHDTLLDGDMNQYGLVFKMVHQCRSTSVWHLFFNPSTWQVGAVTEYQQTDQFLPQNRPAPPTNPLVGTQPSRRLQQLGSCLWIWSFDAGVCSWLILHGVLATHQDGRLVLCLCIPALCLSQSFGCHGCLTWF